MKKILLNLPELSTEKIYTEFSRKLFFIIAHSIFLSFFLSCSGTQEDNPKIKFDLAEFTSDGLRERPKGVFSPINYEFCIPANEVILEEVKNIDSTVEVMKGSKGRSGCTDKEWLCIGSSRQPGFKKVINKIAALNYVRKISETFWE